MLTKQLTLSALNSTSKYVDYLEDANAAVFLHHIGTKESRFLYSDKFITARDITAEDGHAIQRLTLAFDRLCMAGILPAFGGCPIIMRVITWDELRNVNTGDLASPYRLEKIA